MRSFMRGKDCWMADRPRICRGSPWPLSRRRCRIPASHGLRRGIGGIGAEGIVIRALYRLQPRDFFLEAAMSPA